MTTSSWLAEQRQGVRDFDLEDELAALDSDSPEEDAAARDLSSREADQDFPGGVKGGQYVTLYNTQTGLPSTVRRFQAVKMMTWLFPNSTQRVWTRRSPGISQAQGQIKCFLHPESPEFEETRKAGLGIVCNEMDLSRPPRGNLRSVADKMAHETTTHKRQYAVFQEYRDRQRDEEFRDFQRENMAYMRAMREQAERAPVSSSGEASAPPAVEMRGSEIHRIDLTQGMSAIPTVCSDCDFSAKNDFGLKAHRRFKHGGA